MRGLLIIIPEHYQSVNKRKLVSIACLVTALSVPASVSVLRGSHVSQIQKDEYMIGYQKRKK